MPKFWGGLILDNGEFIDLDGVNSVDTRGHRIVSIGAEDIGDEAHVYIENDDGTKTFLNNVDEANAYFTH